MRIHGSTRAPFIVAALALALGLGASFPSAALAGDGAAAGGWEQIRSEDGIRVSRKEIAGSSFVAFRGEGVVDAPLLLVGSVLVDITRNKEWVDSVNESRILRTVSETEYVTYTHIDTPITMSDRDFVTNVTLNVDPAAKVLAIRMHSVNDPAAPKTGYVRGDLANSSFILTSVDGGKKTLVAAEVHCDPKGSIASWIVNLFQKNWGYNTLTALRAQVKKADVAVHPRLKAVLESKGFFGPPAEVLPK